MLNVIMLSVTFFIVMLNVIMLIVVILSVVAPKGMGNENMLLFYTVELVTTVKVLLH
jgi:hypothetical protein